MDMNFRVRRRNKITRSTSWHTCAPGRSLLLPAVPQAARTPDWASSRCACGAALAPACSSWFNQDIRSHYQPLQSHRRL